MFQLFTDEESQYIVKLMIRKMFLNYFFYFALRAVFYANTLKRSFNTFNII
jgi:hypothetical protein